MGGNNHSARHHQYETPWSLPRLAVRGQRAISLNPNRGRDSVANSILAILLISKDEGSIEFRY